MSHCKIRFSFFRLPASEKKIFEILLCEFVGGFEVSLVTIKHDWNAGFIVYEGWEWEHADFMCQFYIVGFDKLDIVFVSVIVNGF